jgi:hypothetical protein
VLKTRMLCLILLPSAVWLQAQSGSPVSGAGQTPAKTSNLTTVEGCLRSSGGRYTVTDASGMIHDLQGNTARLSRYVGHEVEITGKPSVRTTDTSMMNAASSATEEPSLTVESAKQISGNCNSATR